MVVPALTLLGRKPRKKRKKLRALSYPSAEGVRYTRELLNVVAACERLVKERLLPQIARWMGDSRAPTTDRADADSGEVRLDDLTEEVAKIFELLLELMRVDDPTATRKAIEMLERVQRKHALKFVEAYDGVLPINPLVGEESWLREQMSLATSENIALIKSIPERLLSETKGIVTRGIVAGERHEKIAEDIKARFGVARSRASLIARDQVGKWNGALNEHRQVDAGVTEYEWSTSNDERVRPEHQARDGKVIKWSEPPSDGHPGQPIRCRCSAIPVLPEFDGEGEET